MNFNMKYFYKYIDAGKDIPLYMGITYIDLAHDRALCVLIPFNILLSVCIYIYSVVTSKFFPYKTLALSQRKLIYKRGYDKGRNEEMIRNKQAYARGLADAHIKKRRKHEK